MTELTQAQLDQLYTDWSALGAKAERERIDKLLEAKEHQAMRAGQGKPMPERMEYLAAEISIRQVRALIKGEQK